eukprot:jgi/Mesvir1/17960/Mv13004-RA.1
MEQKAAEVQAVEDLITKSANGTRKRPAAEAGCSSARSSRLTPFPGKRWTRTIHQAAPLHRDPSDAMREEHPQIADKLQSLAQYQAQNAETRQERQDRAEIEDREEVVRGPQDPCGDLGRVQVSKRSAQAQEGLSREELEERKAARVTRDAREDKARLDLQMKSMDNMLAMHGGRHANHV